MTRKNLLLGVISVVLLTGAIWLFFSHRADAPTEQQATSTPTPQATTTTTTLPTGTTEVKLAFLDTSGNGTGPERGCDNVFFRTVQVNTTTAPLTSALKGLFAMQNEDVEGKLNFIARTNDTLSFDTATVQNGVARIYLKGSLSGLAGVCDNPRAKIQIEETAKQFPTVQSVELYLNGEKTQLQPNEQ